MEHIEMFVDGYTAFQLMMGLAAGELLLYFNHRRRKNERRFKIERRRKNYRS